MGGRRLDLVVHVGQRDAVLPWHFSRDSQNLCRCLSSLHVQGVRVLPADQRSQGPGRARVVHEIKHDGFRILAGKDSAGVRLITRNGNDFTARFPLIISAVAALPARSCVIDGEAIVCDENGLAIFELIRGHGSKTSAVLCAFDLVELDGRDLRRRPIEERKALLTKLGVEN